MIFIPKGWTVIRTTLNENQKTKNNNYKKPLDTHRMLSIVTSIAFVALKYCWAAYLQQYARFVIICGKKILKPVSDQRINQYNFVRTFEDLIFHIPKFSRLWESPLHKYKGLCNWILPRSLRILQRIDCKSEQITIKYFRILKVSCKSFYYMQGQQCLRLLPFPPNTYFRLPHVYKRMGELVAPFRRLKTSSSTS